MFEMGTRSIPHGRPFGHVRREIEVSVRSPWGGKKRGRKPNQVYGGRGGNTIKGDGNSMMGRIPENQDRHTVLEWLSAGQTMVRPVGPTF